MSTAKEEFLGVIWHKAGSLRLKLSPSANQRAQGMLWVAALLLGPTGWAVAAVDGVLQPCPVLVSGEPHLPRLGDSDLDLDQQLRRLHTLQRHQVLTARTS